jgi:hypothetical protein
VPITVRTKSVFHCKCVLCGWDWDTEKKPKRCARCKRRGWNGEDHRFSDPYDGVPIPSQIEIGTEAPRPPSYEAMLESFIKAQTIIDKLITDNPCDHSKPGECACAEKEVLAEIDQQIEKLKALRPLRSTYLVQKNGQP